ncbi:hypothetical protein N8737_01475 [Verrucomicrobia bacterium]|nr:hypothetical protein [Verrucomicrobiota bacterium]MDA7657349.1 hypothetical protein [Verrucomicrobiota bacterium]
MHTNDFKIADSLSAKAPSAQFVYNRPEAVAQRQLQEMADQDTARLMPV